MLAPLANLLAKVTRGTRHGRLNRSRTGQMTRSGPYRKRQTRGGAGGTRTHDRRIMSPARHIVPITLLTWRIWLETVAGSGDLGTYWARSGCDQAVECPAHDPPPRASHLSPRLPDAPLRAAVRDHVKVPAGGRVEVPAGGQQKSPSVVRGVVREYEPRAVMVTVSASHRSPPGEPVSEICGGSHGCYCCLP